MKTQGKQILAVLIVAGMIIFSGCCGFTGGGNPTTTLSGGEDGADDDTTATTKASGGGDILGGLSLDSLMNLGKPAGYTITYDITAASNDETSVMTYVQYLSGEKLRIDMATEVDGESTETRIYSIPSGSYMCMSSEGAWTCFGGEDQNQQTTGGFDLDAAVSDISDSADEIKPTYEGTRTIVGVTAQCFRVEMDGDANRYCAHPNYNIPLLAESIGKNPTDEGYYKMEAKSLNLGAPADSVFSLPAEPMDMSELLGSLGDMNLPEE
jgi:hypothetical protein